MSKVWNCIVMGAMVGASAGAQDVFRSPVTWVDTTLPHTPASGTLSAQMAAGDLDGDGDGDLALAVKVASLPMAFVVAIALQQESGTFTLGTPLFVGATIQELELADLDADGYLDVVVATAGVLAEVQLFLGAGDGSFAAPVTRKLGGDAHGLKIADVNADGHLDLLTISTVTERISTILGDGSGGLAPTIFSFANGGSTSVDVGDIDGDTIPDLVLGRGGILETMIGQGDGRFTPGVTISEPAGFAWQVALLDANADGQLDVAASSLALFDHKLSVLVGDGAGSFTAVSTTEAARYDALEAVDVDEDGDLDLVALVSIFRGEIAVLLNDGSGVFEEVTFGTASRGDDFEIADMNGDGDLDVVSFDVASSGGAEVDDARLVVTLLRGQGTGGFVGSSSGRDDTVKFNDFVAADFDADGNVDILALDADDGRMLTMEHTEFGAFESSRAFLAPTPVDFTRAADLDGDGDLDAVFVSQGGAAVLRNDGALVFTALAPIAGSSEAAGVVLLDADGDGHLDVVVAAEDDQQMLVFLNAGDATFGAAISHATAGRPVGFAVGDHDGDGLDDLVVAQSFTNDNDMFLSNGDGSFTRFASVMRIFGHESVASGDVNADGLLDVVLGAGAQGVRLSLATSATTFAPAVILSPTAFDTEGDVEIADVDRDGNLDVVFVRDNIAPFGLSELVILRGRGDGTFEPEQVAALPEGARTMILADVTNDVAPEAIVGGDHWMVTVLANTRGVWQDLGEPLVGSAGLPRLFGTGSLVAAEPFELSLRDAAPSSPVTLLIGFQTLFAPLKGGVLVPDPVKFIFGLTTDGAGDVAVSGAWPAGLEGIDVALQWWLADPEGVQGFAASNALSAETRAR